MLAQQFRFHGYGSLKFLYHRGKTFRTRSISLRAAPNPRRADSRCAVVVTKKVQKNAPNRNRIRRRVYEVIRTNWDHIKPSHDLLINVYDPQATTLPYEELERQIVSLLMQAEIWQEAKKDGKTA